MSGMLYVSSSADGSNGLTAEKFNKWYNGKHISELLQVPGLNTAIRYQNTDPSAKPNFICLYPLKNLATLASPELQGVSNVHEETFPGPSHDAKDFADLKMRVYAHIQTYEPAGSQGKGPANLLLSVALTPKEGTDQDFDKWYREEHLADLSKCPGYVRSRRFKSVPGVPGAEEAPEYIAFHEFEGEELPMEKLIETTKTEWSRKHMENVRKNETTVWKKIFVGGEENFEL